MWDMYRLKLQWLENTNDTFHSKRGKEGWHLLLFFRINRFFFTNLICSCFELLVFQVNNPKTELGSNCKHWINFFFYICFPFLLKCDVAGHSEMQVGYFSGFLHIWLPQRRSTFLFFLNNSQLMSVLSNI